MWVFEKASQVLKNCQDYVKLPQGTWGIIYEYKIKDSLLVVTA